VNNYQHLLKDLERATERSRVKLNPDQKLSLCMIVKNEEKYLADALKSVQGVVDEIIVVDTGSTDRTVEIAREFGSKVFFYEWNDDFAAARNESLKHATGDWILMLDADERLDEHLKDNLRVFLIPTERPVRYQVFIRNYMREKDAGSILGHYMVRLFRKTPDTQFFGVIHEQIFPNTGIVTIPEESLVLWHYGYEDLDIKAKKIEERNIPLIRKALDQAKQLNNMDLYSFYAFYLGSSMTDPQEAQKWLRICIDSAISPEESAHIPVAYIDYLRSFYYLNDLEGGIAAAREALEKFPDMRQYPDFWDYFGFLQLSHQNPDEAITCFENALRYSQTDQDQTVFYAAQSSRIGGWGTLLHLAMAYAVKQDLAQSQKYMHQAVEAYPGADKEKLIQEVQKYMGDTSLIQGYFEAKLRQDQELSQYDIKNLSNIYLKQEKPFEALMLQTRVHGPEKTIESAFELCKIYEASGRRELAHKTYQGILNLDPDNFKAKMQKTILEWIEANLEAFDHGHFEALRQACQKPQDWLLLGEFCLQVGAVEQAGEAFEQVLNQEPDHYDALLRKALLAQLNEDLETAEQVLQNLIQTQPERSEALIQLGNLWVAAQRFADAETLFKQGSASDWYVSYALGVCVSAQGRLDEAEVHLKKALELAPEQPEAQQLLTLVQQAQVEQVVS